jgi:hypothetical protein
MFIVDSFGQSAFWLRYHCSCACVDSDTDILGAFFYGVWNHSFFHPSSHINQDTDGIFDPRFFEPVGCCDIDPNVGVGCIRADTRARWKHPSDLSRGRAFLWTAPSQHVYRLLTYAISNTILKSSPCLASMRRARLGPFFPFPHPPTPVLSPYILYLPNPSLVEEDRWKGGFIRPVHRPSPHGAVDVKSPAFMHPVDYRVNPSVFYL